MAKNYTINEKTKSIIISGTLTAAEEQLIKLKNATGAYTLKVKSENRVKEEDIIAYLNKKKKADVAAEFAKQKEATIKDKNGKERKAGYLVALKWFRENHKDLYEAVKAEKNK